MAYWHYSGRITTPINVPGKGPIVLRPREKFHAPQSAVAHLLRLNPPLVKRLPDPPPSAEPPPKKEAAPVTVAEVKSDRTQAPTQAPVETGDVVSAAHVEAKPELAVVDSASEDSTAAAEEEVSEGEGTSSVSEESESRPRRKRRPDR
jgi:hypothetical protein